MSERVAYFKIAGIEDVWNKQTQKMDTVQTSTLFQIGQDSSLINKYDSYINLNISFDIPYMGNSVVPMDAKFSIDNIEPNLKKSIATNVSIFQDRKRKIEFWCGYKDNERKLFDGRIEKAYFSGMPDSTLYINAWTSLYSMGNPVKIKFNGIKAISLLEDAVRKCGMTLNITNEIKNNPQLQRIVPFFSFEDSAYAYLTRVIRDITSFNLIKDQIIISVENNIVYVRYAEKLNNIKPIEIGYWNGMVGRPEPTAMGVNIRMILNPNFYVGQTIELNSTEDELYNGFYNIYGTVFHGNTRDEEFYTDLICQRITK